MEERRDHISHHKRHFNICDVVEYVRYICSGKFNYVLQKQKQINTLGQSICVFVFNLMKNKRQNVVNLVQL